MVHFPSHHPARYPPPVQFPVRILPLERLPKWWGLLLTFLLTMAIATPNYLVDSKFNKAMKAIPFLAAGMIFNMLLRKKNKSPMLSEIIHIMEYTLYIYLSVSVGYIVLFLPPLISSNKRNIPRLLSGNVYHPCSRL